MHNVLLILHSYFRWVVLLAGLVALARMAAGWMKSLPWTSGDRRAGLLFTVALDIQLLFGVALYAVSPMIKKAMSDMATAMRTPDVRFFVADHPATMVIALALAHAGSVVARRAPTDGAKFRRGAVFYALSLVLILQAIPWSRLFSPPGR
jgi:hypothetical protein